MPSTLSVDSILAVVSLAERAANSSYSHIPQSSPLEELPGHKKTSGPVPALPAEVWSMIATFVFLDTGWGRGNYWGQVGPHQQHHRRDLVSLCQVAKVRVFWFVMGLRLTIPGNLSRGDATTLSNDAAKRYCQNGRMGSSMLRSR
jgi:hypothetical protein